MTNFYAEKQGTAPFESPRDTAPSVAEMLDLILVREFECRAEAALPGRVARVVLFGSRVRGEVRPESTIPSGTAAKASWSGYSRPPYAGYALRPEWSGTGIHSSR